MGYHVVRFWTVGVVAALLCTTGKQGCTLTTDESSPTLQVKTSPGTAFRPPAVPLVMHTPYFCAWSAADRLADDDTRHWTGKPQPIIGLIRVDGTVYRVIGAQPKNTPALPQTGVRVTPTRSIYEFANDAIRLRLTFMSPLLPDDLNVLSRPASYLIWDVESADGKPHDVQLLTGASGLLCVNLPGQAVEWRREQIAGLTAMRIGSEDQPVLGSKGDDHRIDWGYCYLATPAKNATVAAGSRDALARAFSEQGVLRKAEDVKMPQPAGEDSPAIAVAEDVGRVTKQATRFQVLAYDEVYHIQYFGTDLTPYWRRNGAEAPALLKSAVTDMEKLRTRCEKFDRELTADAEKTGGPKYATICALAYRQTFAGCGLAADAKGAPLLFPKENHSNGCISTVDVIYPMSPQLLLLSPTLTKAMLIPILDYAASPRWTYPYAPHDLGTYPIVSGQLYGMSGPDADRMPVEESGNMLILLAALARAEGNADFAEPYWPALAKWADYLAANGFDPANQLCTDDFAGHLARNANLAVKAVLGVASMSRLCELSGRKADAAKYAALAREGAAKWQQLAGAGDHSVLAFGQPGTWSQKYNLVWDALLGLDVFPPEVARKEAAFYKTRLQRYGLPLDSRGDASGMTKSDWTMWVASLGRTPDYVASLAAPLYDFYNETPDRAAMTDFYNLKTGRKFSFTARPVNGGVFLPMLADPEQWSKWAARDRDNPRKHIWAAFPKSANLKLTAVVPTADKEPAKWRYTTDKPADTWMKSDFDDSGWKEGVSGFGVSGTPGAIVGTQWNTADIWLRRVVKIPTEARQPLTLLVHHDEAAEIYLDGVLATKLAGYSTAYEPVLRLSRAATPLLKPGATIAIAVHCRQTIGGQYIDVGIASQSARE